MKRSLEYEVVDPIHNKQVPEGLKLLRVAWTGFQNLLMGGVLYGYTALLPMLRAPVGDEGGPGLSPKYIQVMFFAAVSFSSLSPLLADTVVDTLGPRWASAAFTGMFSLGALLFACSDKEKEGLFVPALCLMAFAGPGISLAGNYTLAYFPEKGSAVATFISCCFHCSFFVFFLLTGLWESHRGESGSLESSYQDLFYGLSYITAGTALISFCVHSDEAAYLRVEGGEEGEEGEGLGRGGSGSGSADESERGRGRSNAGSSSPRSPHSQTSSAESAAAAGGGGGGGGIVGADLDAKAAAYQSDLVPSGIYTDTTADADDADAADASGSDNGSASSYNEYSSLSLSDKLSSPAFARLAAFFSLATFWVNFRIGTLDAELGDSMLMPFQVHWDYVELFNLVLVAGVVGVPAFNWLLQRLGPAGFTPVLVGIACLSMVWNVGVLGDTEQAMVPTFLCYALFRTCVFCLLCPYVHDVFGAEYRGVLLGVLFLISGCVGLLAVPLALWADGTCADRPTDYTVDPCDTGRWTHLYLVKAATTAYFFYFAFQDWADRRHYYRALHHQQQVQQLLGETEGSAIKGATFVAAAAAGGGSGSGGYGATDISGEGSSLMKVGKTVLVV